MRPRSAMPLSFVQRRPPSITGKGGSDLSPDLSPPLTSRRPYSSPPLPITAATRPRPAAPLLRQRRPAAPLFRQRKGSPLPHHRPRSDQAAGSALLRFRRPRGPLPLSDLPSLICCPLSASTSPTKPRRDLDLAEIEPTSISAPDPIDPLLPMTAKLSSDTRILIDGQVPIGLQPNKHPLGPEFPIAIAYFILVFKSSPPLANFNTPTSTTGERTNLWPLFR